MLESFFLMWINEKSGKMKTIAVVSDSVLKNGRLSSVGEIIKKNILEVFEGKAVVNNYYIDQFGPETRIAEDLIIVMAGSRANQVRDYVINHKNIIVAERAFQKSGLSPLFNLPEGTDVLVVNDNIEMVLDSISSLYHIGLKHINLIPFDSEKNYEHIHYALSPAEPEYVPTYIPHVYDVGSRLLDIPTMLLIINILQIEDKQTQQNLYDYYQKLFSPNEGIIQNYNKLVSKTEILDQLLDMSHDGILLTDKEGKIIINNKKFIDQFELSGEVKGEYLHEIITGKDFENYYDKDFQEDLIFYGKKIFNIEKKELTYFNYEIRMYFSFQEVTHIKKLEQNLTRKLRLKGQIARYTFNDIIGSSKRMKVIISKAKKIAKSDLTVLITGESGTGKEVMAQAIHNASPRKNQPFIAINSAALSDNLIESELFGYDSGSFTGALKQGKKGLFERANNGTIFLDEIGDMPHHLQSKLLRVLQERQITPIGSDRNIDLDLRVIAATHKDPKEMVESGNFRRDLFYRLNVFPIKLPTLRDRSEDIPLLLQSFTGNHFTFTDECLNSLINYNWPGNTRELFNITQYITTLEESDTVEITSLPYYLETDLKSSVPVSYEELYKDERFTLEEKTVYNHSIAILKTVRMLNKISKTAGRKHVMEVLEKEDLSIRENQLRKTLETLNFVGFIITEKGRKGSFVTEKGIRFLRHLDKQV